MCKWLYTILCVSNIAFATDYTNPIVDITDTKKYPPAMIVPATYEWPATINDDPKYVESPARYYNRPPCKSKKLDILGTCIAMPHALNNKQPAKLGQRR